MWAGQSGGERAGSLQEPRRSFQSEQVCWTMVSMWCVALGTMQWAEVKSCWSRRRLVREAHEREGVRGGDVSPW